MVYEKVYLIGNGRVADDCLRIMVKRNISVEFIEVYAEKFSFTEKLCARLNVPFYHIEKKEMREFLLRLNEKTLIISAHNSYIFPKEVCEKDNLKIINLHIAFLPEYRGMNPSTWAIYHQEQYSGVTWHTVSAKIDNGGIIVQSKVEIEPDDTAMKLMLKCFKQGIQLFDENLDAFLNESYRTFIPENANSHLYLAKDLPNHGILDDSWDYQKTYAFLRSMDYSGSNIMSLPRILLDGKIYEITKYEKNVEKDCFAQKSISVNSNILCMRWGGYCLNCTLREITDADNGISSFHMER